MGIRSSAGGLQVGWQLRVGHRPEMPRAPQRGVMKAKSSRSFCPWLSAKAVPTLTVVCEVAENKVIRVSGSVRDHLSIWQPCTNTFAGRHGECFCS